MTRERRKDCYTLEKTSGDNVMHGFVLHLWFPVEHSLTITLKHSVGTTNASIL